MAATPFLLRVVPQGPAGPWVVRTPKTREVLARGETAVSAQDLAVALLPSGGVVEILDEGDFVVGRVVVPQPPVPLRTRLAMTAISLGVALVVALVLGRLLGGGFLWAAVGVALGGQVVPLARALAARRRASEGSATRRPTAPDES